MSEERLRRMRFRAWHRGTREADFVIGGFFDAHSPSWNEPDMAWFEALLEEDDADILAWAMKNAPVPARFCVPAMDALQRLDFVKL
jgi:antitoxin CptB